MKRCYAFIVVLVFIVSSFCLMPILGTAIEPEESKVVYSIDFESGNSGTILSKGDTYVGEIVEWPEGSGNHALAYTVSEQTRSGNAGLHPYISLSGLSYLLGAQSPLSEGESIVFKCSFASSQYTSSAYMYPFMLCNGEGENYFRSSDGSCPPENEFSERTYTLSEFRENAAPVQGRNNGPIAFCDEKSIPDGTVIYMDNISLTWNGKWNSSLDGFVNLCYPSNHQPIADITPWTTTKSRATTQTTTHTTETQKTTEYIPESIYGDANGDLTVDLKDVLALRKYIGQLSEQINVQASDVNSDNSLDLKDVLLIRKYIAQLIDKLGPELDVTTSTSTTITSTTKKKTTESTVTTTRFHENDTITYNTDQKNGSVGVWWWDDEIIKSPEECEQRLNFLQSNHCTEVYIWVNPTTADFDTIATFIRSANKHGMRVAWLQGDAAWIIPGSTGYDSVFAKFDEYQKQADDDAKFYGLHFDVEPHQFGNIPTDSLWQFYADFAYRVCKQVHDADYKIEWDIPFWTDNLIVNFGEQQEVHLTEALMSASDCVTLMSYRDTAKAMLSSGTYELSLANQTNCKVVFGAEIAKSDEGESVSYWEEGNSFMCHELDSVLDSLSKENLENGYGVAIHHAKNWYTFE